jgi:hypothetical protein
VQTVRFLVRPRADLNGVLEIVPTIDDVELTAIVHAFELRTGMETRAASYGGLIPAHFNFGAMDAHFLGASRSNGDHKAPLLGCSCGEWGCWPFRARIEVGDVSITWSGFEQLHRKGRDYTTLGPFAFARPQYEGALRQLQEALGAESAP